jgi:NAD(P)-dependent dehydrogenase (short-subunit alcohol dehydrogenase family)
MTDSGNSMTDKVCLITGANNGFGFVTARELAARGAKVILLCRDKGRGEKAQADILKATGTSTDLLLADMSLQEQVKRVASEFKARYERLDVLINNAGYAFNKRELTTEGFERTFALNYLAYFTLTLELLPLLLSSAPSRIINTASEAHRWSDISFDNLQGETSFPVKRMPPLPVMYGWTNVMRIMLTYTLAKKLKDKQVTANCFCPGFVPVKRSSQGAFMNALLGLIQYLPAARTPEQAAQTILELATSRELQDKTGLYYSSGELSKSAAQTYDKTVRETLWQKTLLLTGYADPFDSSHPPANQLATA